MSEITKKKPDRESRAYKKAATELAFSFAPTIYPCTHCGWPVVSGYCCTTCGSYDPEGYAKRHERV